MRWIVVIDTNVLLSGLGWRGKPYQCLELARTGVVGGVTCPEILEELEQKLRSKLRFSDEQIGDTITDLLSFLRLVTITNTFHVIPADPDDDKVLECDILGNATHIVTGDRRHLLPLQRYGEIAIISAAELLSLVSPR